MAKKEISRFRAAGKFGFLGAVIGLGITLFWPSIHPTTLLVNTAIGYCSGFIVNYFFRAAKGK
jgi:putative flippase GtrA